MERITWYVKRPGGPPNGASGLLIYNLWEIAVIKWAELSEEAQNSLSTMYSRIFAGKRTIGNPIELQLPKVRKTSHHIVPTVCSITEKRNKVSSDWLFDLLV